MTHCANYHPGAMSPKLPVQDLMIDWAATGAMLSGIGTVLVALAVMAAAVIGGSTFNSWRKQRIAERRMEQAERILTATYRVRDALSRVRSPAMWGHELENAEQALRDNGQWEKILGGDREKDRYRTAQAYYKRIADATTDRQLMEECQPVARAFFW